MIRITKTPEERRGEILLAARTLFFEKGFDATSITDIVKSIGVAQGLFYYYFKSKQEIYKAVLWQYADEQVAIICEILCNELLPLQARITKILQVFIDMNNDDNHIFMDEPMLEEHMELHQQLALYTTEMLIPTLSEVLSDQMEKGFLRRLDIDITSRFLAYGVFGLIHSANHCGLENEPDQLAAIFELISGLFFMPNINQKNNLEDHL